MKSFLVAVDFSNCSINALMFAAQVAYLSDVRIEMIWVNNPEKTKVKIVENASSPLIDEINQKFVKLEEELRAKYFGLKIDHLIREGKVYKEVSLQAEESQSWLIVAGTNGPYGLSKLWMGNNVYRMVHKAPCPVISVRSGVSYSNQLNTIVLPVDSTMETREKVAITAEIAKLTHSRVIVLKLYSTNMREIMTNVDIYASQVVDFLTEEGIQVEVDETHTENLTDTTIDYASRVHANLIAIMSEQEKKATNFFKGSFAHQMIDHAPVPVLTVRPKDML